MGWKQWTAIAEVVLGNLAWIDALDLEGFLLALGLSAAAAGALWYFAGTTWLVVAASLYVALLVAVRIVANRGRDDRQPG